MGDGQGNQPEQRVPVKRVTAPVTRHVRNDQRDGMKNLAERERAEALAAREAGNIQRKRPGLKRIQQGHLRLRGVNAVVVGDGRVRQERKGRGKK
jgi:hypothetical protein